MINDTKACPHRRKNLLTGEWVLVSPHRTQRPWQGKQEDDSSEQRLEYDPDCYLCPGNARAGGQENPPYSSTYVFGNDFAALLNNAYEGLEDSLLYQVSPVRGICRVICYSPRHDLTLPEMPVSAIREVVDLWSEQIQELGQVYKWVQIFENKGAVMGCSNPHPHGQVWAGDFLPNEPAKEDREQRVWYEKNETPLLVDYHESERRSGERVVVQNDHWTALVPYWAVWPYETLVLPQRHVQRLPDLSGLERDALADLMKRILSRYDNLFETSFPYSMGWHGAPTDGMDHEHWQLHAHIYPPLLRSATVKKFMVGYEMLAEAQRDLTAEQAADRLRSLSDLHYKESS